MEGIRVGSITAGGRRRRLAVKSKVHLPKFKMRKFAPERERFFLHQFPFDLLLFGSGDDYSIDERHRVVEGIQERSVRRGIRDGTDHEITLQRKSRD
jgi:hypothetical protein